MRKGLSRRALFALPAALSVGAVAGKAMRGSNPLRSGILSATEMRIRESAYLDAGRSTLFDGSFHFTLEPLPPVSSVWRLEMVSARFTDAELAATLGIEPSQPAAIGIDGGGTDDRLAVAIVQSKAA